MPRWHGWQHAGDFRACRRREIVPQLIAAATPIFASNLILIA
jgi:hypothetical protein